MKTKTIIIVFIFFSMMSSQTIFAQIIPVTDAGATGALTSINAQLSIINSGIQKISTEMSSQNQILNQISQTLQEMNQKLGSIEKMDTDLINSKRIAPDYVQSSSEVRDLLEIKDDAIRTLKSIKKTVDGLENLEGKEINEFVTFYGNSLSKITEYFTNSQKALHTGSIIDPEERLKIVKRNTDQIRYVLREIIKFGNMLQTINKGRATSKSIKSF